MEWEQLVVTHTVVGVNAHNARLVAAMRIQGLTHILTFNNSGFTRYSEIVTVHPTEITLEQVQA